MDLKKKAFLDAYQKTFGNVSQACKLTEISRFTFYEWKKKDAKFASEIEAIEPEEILVDFAENALIQRVSKGDTTAIIFLLKTKGKKRGYVERKEFEHSGQVDYSDVREAYIKMLDDSSK